MAAVKTELEAVPWVLVMVRERSGAYVTQTVRGQRASATMSAEAAVVKLAGKLWGAGAAHAFVKCAAVGASEWRIAPSAGALK